MLNAAQSHTRRLTHFSTSVYVVVDSSHVILILSGKKVGYFVEKAVFPEHLEFMCKCMKLILLCKCVRVYFCV